MARPKKIQQEEVIEAKPQLEAMASTLTQKDFERFILLVKFIQIGYSDINEFDVSSIKEKAKFISKKIFET